MAIEEIRRGTRIRVNVSSTSKGFPSYEHTVEISDEQADPYALIERVLKLSDYVEANLLDRYAALQDRPKEVPVPSVADKNRTAI